MVEEVQSETETRMETDTEIWEKIDGLPAVDTVRTISFRHTFRCPPTTSQPCEPPIPLPLHVLRPSSDSCHTSRLASITSPPLSFRELQNPDL